MTDLISIIRENNYRRVLMQDWAEAVLEEAIEEGAPLHETMTAAVSFNCGSIVIRAIWWSMRYHNQFGVNSDTKDLDDRRRLIIEKEEDWERSDEEYHFSSGPNARQIAKNYLQSALHLVKGQLTRREERT